MLLAAVAEPADLPQIYNKYSVRWNRPICSCVPNKHISCLPLPSKRGVRDIIQLIGLLSLRPDYSRDFDNYHPRIAIAFFDDI